MITEAELAQMKRRAVITSLADEEAARVEREKMLEVGWVFIVLHLNYVDGSEEQVQTW